MPNRQSLPNGKFSEQIFGIRDRTRSIHGILERMQKAYSNENFCFATRASARLLLHNNNNSSRNEDARA